MASRTTSRHHWIIDIATTNRAINKQYIPYPWNQHTSPTPNRNAPSADVSGHGLNSTRWNGCRGMYVFYAYKLFTWKVNVLVILKTYKGDWVPLINLQFIV